MIIEGHGFLARHLARIADRHADVLLLAAGVSHPQHLPTAYVRERLLVERAVADCLRDDRKLVFFSSAAVYGGPGCAGREDLPARPPTDYGRHKAGLEQLITESGVRHLSVRLGYVLGPQAPAFRLVPSLVRQIDAGEVTVYRGTYRDLVHVDDVVTVLDALLTAGVDREVVNLASGRCVLIDDIVRHVERRLGRTARWTYVGGQTRHCMSMDKLRSLLPPEVELIYPPHYYEHVIDCYLTDIGRLEPQAGGPIGAVVRAGTAER